MSQFAIQESWRLLLVFASWSWLWLQRFGRQLVQKWLSIDLQRKWQKFKSKGQSRISIMVVPHGEKRIINFQLSLFMISFGIGLFSILLVVSLTSLVSEDNDSSVKETLSEIDVRNYSEIQNIKKNRKKITELEDLVAENHKTLLALIQVDENEALNYKPLALLEDLASSEILAQEKKKHVRYVSEVYELHFLRQRLERELHLLRSIAGFVHERSVITRNTPFAWPVEGRVSSGFGVRTSPTNSSQYEYHPGVDIAAPFGREILAPANGIVHRTVYNRSNVGYGTHVILKHSYGFYTLYGHCDRLLVKTGQKISKGQRIATVGVTGRTTGAHLHYEVLFSSKNQRTNPEEYLPGL